MDYINGNIYKEEYKLNYVSDKTKEIMHLASYVITGLKDVLLEGGPDKFIDNFNKMINESLDN